LGGQPLFKPFLQKIWLFENLEESSLENLAGRFREESHPEGQYVYRLGETSDAFYVLRTGSVAIVRDAVGKPVQLLARLKAGDFFGESGLLDALPRSASARTLERCRLLAISRASLLEFLERQPLLKLQLRRAAIERHSANVDATAADRAVRTEVRITVDREVVLGLSDGSEVRARLDNLSLGGAAIEGVPDDWRIQRKVSFTLGLPKKAPLLDLDAVVTWRKGRKVGLSFRDPTPDQRVAVSRALQELLAGRR
jgi:CRP-like cAMP-binding protein